MSLVLMQHYCNECWESFCKTRSISHIHMSLVKKWRSYRHRKPTCDEAWMRNPICRVIGIMAQVPDLHVAVIDAENKGQGE